MCKKDTYQLNYYCNNCEQNVTIEIPKGNPRPAKAVCTNCGCETAVYGKKIDVKPTFPGKYVKPYTHPWEEKTTITWLGPETPPTIPYNVPTLPDPYFKVWCSNNKIIGTDMSNYKSVQS